MVHRVVSPEGGSGELALLLGLYQPVLFQCMFLRALLARECVDSVHVCFYGQLHMLSLMGKLRIFE